MTDNQKDPIIEKIKKLYEVHGEDTSDMEDEEFERIKSEYLKKGLKILDFDLREAQRKRDQIEILKRTLSDG